MSTTAELTELRDMAGRMRHLAIALRGQHANDPSMRRLVLDADRILADLDLLDADAYELGLTRYTPPPAAAKIQVPDSRYDEQIWQGIDDEGVGGLR
ncbi:hypothetical protein [Mycolicibacterium brumae]|uniref:Uncharacterized protein n=1 Tax=Mycolicibacterium brumae TaxID=85968 RepID=A0A2G5PGH8_9MYCO|nr:hypothetical protein [Mycolicibacterium brumae]MCV7192257.1 hypothetical protein [Mycolicibacterium brumae]PIB77133.1 hypothetical protein CQY22_002435 [Mycolicibacterium brumae]UWW10472.1 hypothetical protein L2Z93_003602 [Mycolicibacterium brumae]